MYFADLECQVEVTQTLLTIPQSALEQLSWEVDPLSFSENYGIELYEETLCLLEIQCSP